MTVDINNRTGYEVAVKYLKIKENPDRMDELRADFEYETNLMKTLNHPNVVKLLGLASNRLWAMNVFKKNYLEYVKTNKLKIPE